MSVSHVLLVERFVLALLKIMFMFMFMHVRMPAIIAACCMQQLHIKPRITARHRAVPCRKAGIPRRRHRHRHPHEHRREDVAIGVRVGVVECSIDEKKHSPKNKKS